MADTVRANLSVEDEKKRAQFLEHINAEDPLGIVIRGLIYIESALIKLLEEGVRKPNAIDFAKDLNFPTKVDLAVALGMLKDDEKAVLLNLNRLRNKLAHNVEVQVGRDDEDALVKSLSEDDRLRLVHFEEKSESGEFPERLRRIVAVQWWKLDERRVVIDEIKQLHPEWEALVKLVRGGVIGDD